MNDSVANIARNMFFSSILFHIIYERQRRTYIICPSLFPSLFLFFRVKKFHIKNSTLNIGTFQQYGWLETAWWHDTKLYAFLKILGATVSQNYHLSSSTSNRFILEFTNGSDVVWQRCEFFCGYFNNVTFA